MILTIILITIILYKLQPRKISATTLATRVTEEWACGNDKAMVGRNVGFRAGGGAHKSHKDARIEYVTEGYFLGVLLDMLKSDPGSSSSSSSSTSS
jgi:HrpA-like RNA helicase